MRREPALLSAVILGLSAPPAAAHEWADYFAYGDANLSPRGFRMAREVAAWARTRQGCLRIIAHLDSLESHAFSLELSRRRAQAVATELALSGVDPARFELDARGAGRPARPTADRTPEPLNRRVVVIADPGETCLR